MKTPSLLHAMEAARAGRAIHLIDPPCGAEPDGEALFVRWPEVVTCSLCVNNLMGYNT